MKNIAAQMVNFDREQMRRIANNMLEQYDEKPQVNHLPDYCNDPSASWPIIEKYRISILDQLTEWCVDAKGVSPIFDTRPLRAAMIVFLLMQEANNA